MAAPHEPEGVVPMTPPGAPPDEAPKVHPRARRLSVKSQQPTSEVQAQHPEPMYNTQHVFEVHPNGQASVCVNDTLELRSAFLSYCGNSSMRPTEMHRMAGPCMAAPSFINLCKDLNLVEPEGPLSLMAVGITYATAKSDDSDGLTYAQFLDSLMELAFSVGGNVAGQLQAVYAAKPIPPPRPPGLLRSDSSMRARSSEPGFAPHAPPPRMSEAGGPTPPVPSGSPDNPRALQPRLSESGRFQRPNSLIRSLDASGGSILGKPMAQLDRELRSSSAGGMGCEPQMSPRPPSALRTSMSGGPPIPNRPTFRPSIAQRPLKARSYAQAPKDGDMPSEGPELQHPLHCSVMSSWSGEGTPSSARSSPLGRISAMFQAPGVDDESDDDDSPSSPSPAPARASPLSRISAKFQAPSAPEPHFPSQPSPARASPLSRVSAMFQAPGGAEDNEDGDDALFPSRPASGAQQSRYGVIAESQAHRPSSGRVSSSGGGRPPSAGGRPGSGGSLLSRTSISGPSMSSPGRH